MNCVNDRHKEDCPKCHGAGGYFMTSSDYEEPIQCNCDDYEGEDWEKLKAKWIKDGWELGGNND